MKKWLSLAVALVLCTGIAAACAETTVSEKVIEAYNLELNTKSNTLIVTDRSTGQKYVADTEMNRLSDPYAYISCRWNTAKSMCSATAGSRASAWW